MNTIKEHIRGPVDFAVRSATKLPGVLDPPKDVKDLMIFAHGSGSRTLARRPHVLLKRGLVEAKHPIWYNSRCNTASLLIDIEVCSYVQDSRTMQ